MVSAAVFGVGDELDTFNTAFTIASFFISITAGVLQVAQVPIYLETKHQQGKQAAQQLIATIFAFLLISLLGICIVLLFGFQFILPQIYSGFAPDKITTTTRLASLMLPFVIIGGAALFAASLLNAEEEFKLTALTPGWTALSVIIALLVLGKSLGVYALAIGILAGALVEFSFLTYLLTKYEISLWPRWQLQNERLRQVWRSAFPLMLACILSGVMPIIDQSFAARLQAGDVAALGFGYRIISLYLALFATAVGTSVLPHFSKLSAAQDWEGLKRAFYGSIYKFVLPVCILSALLIISFSEPLVRVFFQRGAFTSEATSRVATIQMMYALQLPAYVIQFVGFRLLSALQANRFTIWITAVSLLCCISFDYLLSRIWGVSGIAMAVSLVYTITTFITLFIIKRELAMRQRRQLLSA